jgi:hypothetical protein
MIKYDLLCPQCGTELKSFKCKNEECNFIFPLHEQLQIRTHLASTERTLGKLPKEETTRE